MYDQIFDDFATIKQHLENNGNHQFEESAVFELLESLYPLHGSAQAIQIIIDMLDAQRIRDENYGFDKAEASDDRSTSSNEKDDNDIIEVKVPKKIHPVIDLTENSIESDNSEVSCHEVHSFSDSDASKNFNDDSNLTCESATRSNSEKQLLNYLAILDQPNEGIQLNNDQAETSEILEENNNDPNNNFDEENVAGNHIVQNNSNVPNILPDVPEVPRCPEALDNLFDGLFDRDPVPGCSKESSLNLEIDNITEPAANSSVFNSVPGCSKDLNSSHNHDMFEKNDELMEKDIACIQEIIPWADSDQTRFLLLKYSNSPDRKQSTLSKLMKEESSRMKIKVKRKASSEIHCVEKKSLKVESMYEMDDSLDIHNLNFDNIISNESSNDSQSSKPLRHTESAFKSNQNSQAFNDAQFPKMFPKTMWSDFESGSPSSSSLVNHDFPVICHTSSNKPMLYHTLKKERNETVVSGLLQEQAQLELLNGKNVTDKPATATSTSVSKPSVNDPFFSNDDAFQWPLNNSLNNHQTKDGVIEKTLKEEADNVLNDFPAMNGIAELGFAKHSGTIPAVSASPIRDKIVIQPSKLHLQNTKNPAVIPAPPKPHIMRPAILNFNNSQHSNGKMLDQKNTLNYTNYSSRLHGYVPPELHAVKKQVPLLNPVQHVTTIMKMATAVRDRASTKEVSRQSCVKNDVNWQFNVRSKHITVKRNPETVKKNTEAVMRNPDALQRDPEVIKSIVIPEPIQPRPLPNNSVAQPGTSGLNLNGTSNSAIIPDQTIYNKLRSIFPDVKSSYIKQICINPPIVNNVKDKAIVLNTLIEHLLTEGVNHLRPVEFVVDQPSIASVTVDEKYEYLLGIFPDADPTFIREFVIKNPSEQEFQDFIQAKLESRDYPTKEQYMARIKITEQIKQYTSDLNIEKFLEIFPDPFKHFEDPSRKCSHQPIASEFLKFFFTRNKLATIAQQYKNNGNNLSLTAKALTSMGPDMKSKRTSVEMPTEDIPLLQEMAFIKNKQKIMNHLNMLKTKEEQLFKELKDQNLLVTCQCCYNDECMPTKSSECNEGHVFCHECIIRGTESALADAEAHVRCFTDCQSEFSLATLQKVLPPTKFSALLQKRQTAEVIAAGVDGLISCPFCHFASIPPAEDKVFKCLNPECMKETCKLCKELNHVPLKCDEVIKTDKARHLIEEKMTEALVRTCYSCKKQFYKEDGCNKMKCTCGALMCYLCSKPIKGYNHFNAQGGANTNLCPLWSDDRVLNAKAVIQVAQDVKKQLLKNNPNLKIDTDSLLPKVPAKTRGPHDDIPNANQLPEHIMRIANVREGNV